MSSDLPTQSLPLEAFLEKFRKDQEAGRLLLLVEYLQLFPGDELGIAREYSGRIRGEAAAEDGAAPGSGSDRVGPYRTLRVLGQGGQGVVYLAEDTRLPRKVALKLLNGRGIATGEVLRRFRREAEIASKLDHPGICGVHDAGVDGGIAWIAMRLVEGEPLSRKLATVKEERSSESLSTRVLSPDSDAEETRNDSGTPRSGPATLRDVRPVLTLIEKVARSLHAAHEAGVIHRDIKPGNIMVTPEGEPVILDFGLARETEGDSASLSQIGDLLGTPAYMSPEQLQANRIVLDRRTDVWSLGVTLYEGVTLLRPFEAPTREGLYQAIPSKDPPDPRLLNRAVSTDLKAVLDMALEKDRDRRYQTAALFADDLARILEGTPTLARPVGPVGRLVRWSRREPWKAALIGLVIVTLPIVATLVTVQVKDRPKIEAARLASLEEDKDAILSTASFELAEGSPAEALRLFEQVLDMEGSSPEAAAGKIMSHLRLEDPESAERALDRYGNLLSGTASAVLLRADVLRAKKQEREAEVMERTAPEPKDALDHHLLAQRALDAGEREREAGRDGREPFGRALSHATRAVLLSPGPRALLLEMRAHAAGHCNAREAAVETAAVLRARWPEALSSHYFAALALDLLEDTSVLDDAIVAYREAIRLKPDYAPAHYNLGKALREKGHLDDAIAAYRDAIQLRPHHVETLTNLGNALTDKGLLDDAIAAYGEAIRLKPDDDRAHTNLGVALFDKGLLDDAIAAHREAIRLKPDYAQAHYNLGADHYAKGLLDNAIAAFGEAIRLKPDSAEASCNLGHALRGVGRFTEALAALRRGHELGSQRAGWSYPSAKWVADLERVVAEETASEARLGACLASGIEPEDAVELARLAKAALRTGRALIAARWYQSAFERNARLAGVVAERHRFHAACAAAKAAAEAADGASDSTWRKQALVWLSEDLDSWEERLEDGKVKEADLRTALPMWQHEAALASVRGDAISSLPKPDQEAWTTLWARVARILAEL